MGSYAIVQDGLAETDPGRLSRPGLMPFRSVDPDAFVGVNAQLN